MRLRLRFRLLVVLLCMTLAGVTVSAKAQVVDLNGIAPSKGQLVGAAVGIVAVGVAIGVGVYYLTRKPSITGCAVSHQSGFELQSEGDRQMYLLTGDTANVKAGDRVRIKGKKGKKDNSGTRIFEVAKLTKDYGACKVQPAAP